MEGWESLYLHVWCLGWEDLRISHETWLPQLRVVGFLILHFRAPNLYSGGQGRSWITFYSPALCQCHFCSILLVEVVTSLPRFKDTGKIDYTPWWKEYKKLGDYILKQLQILISFWFLFVFFGVSLLQLFFLVKFLDVDSWGKNAHL